jgi:hypothetical protein
MPKHEAQDCLSSLDFYKLLLLLLLQNVALHFSLDLQKKTHTENWTDKGNSLKPAITQFSPTTAAARSASFRSWVGCKSTCSYCGSALVAVLLDQNLHP